VCFLYLISSVGVSINLHYCGGKIKAISLSHTDESDCCGKEMEKKMNCCKDKTVSYQVKEDQSSSSTASIKVPVKNIDTHFIFTEFIKSNLYTPSYGVPDFHAPPDIVFSDTYLVNGVFRI